ncbi:unnamed protein product, partial [Iphiclides podalirius]
MRSTNPATASSCSRTASTTAASPRYVVTRTARSPHSSNQYEIYQPGDRVFLLTHGQYYGCLATVRCNPHGPFPSLLQSV